MKKAMNVEHSVSGITLTRENASRFTNRLKKSLKTEGIVLPLNRCQEHLAQAFGASTWHELNENLKKDEQRALALDQSILLNTAVSENNPSLMQLEWVEFEYLINHLLHSMNLGKTNQLDIDAVWYLLKLNRNFNNPQVDLDLAFLSQLDTQYCDIVDRLIWVADEEVAIMDLISKKYGESVPQKVQYDYRKFIGKGKSLNNGYIREVIVFVVWLLKNNIYLFRHDKEELLENVVTFQPSESRVYLESPYPFLKNWCYWYNSMSQELKKEQKDLSLHQAMINAFLYDKEEKMMENICSFLIKSHEMAVNAWKKIPESYRSKITD